MIQLKEDYLIFQAPDGRLVPYESTVISYVVMENVAIMEDILIEATFATVHYFKHELKQEIVTVQEFSDALRDVLVKIHALPLPEHGSEILVVDLEFWFLDDKPATRPKQRTWKLKNFIPNKKTSRRRRRWEF